MALKKVKKWLTLFFSAVFVCSMCAAGAAAVFGQTSEVEQVTVSGGWESTAEVQEKEDGEIVYSFDSSSVNEEPDKMWSAETIVTEQAFRVGRPFTFYSKMYWEYMASGYPMPSCYTFTFAPEKEKAVTSQRQIQIFGSTFGMLEIVGNSANLFEDKNHYDVPQFNKFEVTVGEDYTQIVINDREVKTFRSICAEDFPEGDVYLGIGMRFDGANMNEYRFGVLPVDGVMVQGASEAIIIRGDESDVNFAIDLRCPKSGMTVKNEQGETLTEGNDYRYDPSAGVFTFLGGYCRTLNIGTHIYTLQGESGASAQVKIIVMTDTLSLREWSANITAGSTVDETNGLSVRDASGFVLHRNAPLNDLLKEIQVEFSFSDKEYDSADVMTFVFAGEEGQLRIQLYISSGRVSVYYENGSIAREDTQNYIYIRKQEKHILRLYYSNYGWSIGCDEFDGVPVFPEFSVENLQLTISGRFVNETDVHLYSVTSEQPQETENLNGWSCIQHSQGKLMPDGTAVFSMNDSRFDSIHVGENAFSRERLYTTEGFDVNKPIVLYTHMDWQSCGSGWWGLNLSAEPYDFRISDKTVMPVYDLLIQGPYLGSSIVNRANPAESLPFWDLNNPMVAYSDRTQLNKFVIEIGEENTVITVNDKEQGVFSIAKSRFPSGKVWLSLGAYLTQSDKKVNFAVAAVNAPDTGTGIYQTVTPESEQELCYFVDLHGYDLEVLWGETRLEAGADYNYDAETGRLTFEAAVMRGLLEGKSSGTYPILLRTAGTQAVSPVFVNYNAAAADSDNAFEEHDRKEPAKSGCSSAVIATHSLSFLLLPAVLFVLKKRR